MGPCSRGQDRRLGLNVSSGTGQASVLNEHAEGAQDSLPPFPPRPKRGPDSQPRDQESQALCSEPAGSPGQAIFNFLTHQVEGTIFLMVVCGN